MGGQGCASGLSTGAPGERGFHVDVLLGPCMIVSVGWLIFGSEPDVDLRDVFIECTTALMPFNCD